MAKRKAKKFSRKSASKKRTTKRKSLIKRKATRRKSSLKKAAHRQRRDTRKVFTDWQAVQLPTSFMLTAILGLLITIYWVFPQSLKFGMAFLLAFLLMFFAALISMAKAPIRVVRR